MAIFMIIQRIYIVFFILSIWSNILLAETTLDTSLPAQSKKTNDEELFTHAFSYYEDKDFARALLAFAKLITSFPNSIYYSDAQSSFNSIIRSNHISVFPEKYYPVLSKKLQSTPKATTYEMAKFMLNLYPPRTTLQKTEQLIKRCLSKAPLRFTIHYLAKENTFLRYNGSVIRNGKQQFSFTFGNREIIKGIGENILYFKINGYSPNNDSIQLIPLKYLPYQLQQNNMKQTLRGYSVTISSVIFNRCYKAYFYFDTLTTKTGNSIYGIAHKAKAKSIQFDTFTKDRLNKHRIKHKEIDSIISYAIEKKTTIFDASHPLFTNPLTSYIDRLNYLVKTHNLPQALSLYYWLINQSYAQQIQKQLDDAYKIIIKKITSIPFHLRMYQHGIAEIKEGMLYHGWQTLTNVIEQFEYEQSAKDAQKVLSEYAHNPLNSLYITDITAIAFPITFMGYNKLSDNDERFQVNYKGKSYFLTETDVKGGYEILYSEAKNIEKLNPQLNAIEKKHYRYLYIKKHTKKPRLINLKPTQTYEDQQKLYCEIEDAWTGKIYPGYILIDKIIMNDGTEYYGTLIQPEPTSLIKNELRIYNNFDVSNPILLIKQNTRKIKTNSFYNQTMFDKLNTLFDKKFFTQLKKQSIIPLEKSIIVQSDITSVKHNAKVTKPDETEAVNKKDIQLQNIEDTSTEKTELKVIQQPKSSNSHANFTSRAKQLLYKKLIIKILGALIIIWLGIIGIKIVRTSKQ